jgi:hypothetical protein
MNDLKQRLNLFSSDPVLGGIIEEAKTRIEQLEADRENLLQLLESASEVIGRFVSDEGWAQSDMDMMDAIDAKIASMRSKT